MASVACQVTSCRFNGLQLCTLATLQIGPGSVTVASPNVGVIESSYDGQLRAGYADEFADYTAYASSPPTHTLDGAVCFSFAPL
jgi:hypothetical protein